MGTKDEVDFQFTKNPASQWDAQPPRLAALLPARKQIYWIAFRMMLRGGVSGGLT